MKYLMDVNVLLAAIWTNHSRHAETFAWLLEKELVICPIAELGFLRISTHPRVMNAPMRQARSLLKEFCDERNVQRIDDDLPALNSNPSNSDQVTDHYLADLAAKHGIKLASLDRLTSHPNIEVIA